jgi:ribosomal protein S15P/S13E
MKHPKTWYIPNRIIKVNDKMQVYQYKLTYKAGTNLKNGGFNKIKYDFKPYYSPQQMLTMGVFEGKYMNDGENEFPSEWYAAAKKKNKLSKTPDITKNYYKVKSRLSLQEWQKRGWVPVHKLDKDIRGWFQWYCRYWIGRRVPEIDQIQIKRWRSFVRHAGQIKKDKSAVGNLTKRVKQRQALLQWSHNSKI